MGIHLRVSTSGRQRDQKWALPLHRRVPLQQRCGLRTFVTKHQLHHTQPSGAQPAKEAGPEGAVLAVAELDAQDLPLTGGGDAGGPFTGALT